MSTTTPSGLGHDDARRLLAEHGPNALPRARSASLPLRFLKQFQNPLIYVLLFALAFDVGAWVYGGARGVPVEGLAIAAILLLNATLGALQEYRSEQALARLGAMTAPLASLATRPVSKRSVRPPMFFSTMVTAMTGSPDAASIAALRAPCALC